MEKKVDLEKYIEYYVDDEELSDEELEAYWRFIKGESDKLVNEMIGVKVKWPLIGFGLTTFVVGAIGGFYRSPRTKELQGKPIPPGAVAVAARALMGGTAICVGFAGLGYIVYDKFLSDKY